MSLARINNELRAERLRAASEVVQVGSQLGLLSGSDVRGAQVRTLLVGPPQGSLVLGFSPNCGFCVENGAAWQRLAVRAAELGVGVVWVARDQTDVVAEFEKTTALAGVVIADPTHATYVQLKLGVVPQTLVVDKGGFVLTAQTGILSAVAEADILRSLISIGRSITGMSRTP